jgi:hypothetical protein
MRTPRVAFVPRFALRRGHALPTVAFASLVLSSHPLLTFAQGIGISAPAYQEISQRAAANETSFYVYQDADSGFNHGFPSGFFGVTSAITINTACVDDPNAANGCSTDPTSLDTTRGTVLQVSFGALNQPPYNAGLNIEEPQNWGVLQTGIGYDLTAAATLVVDVRSPTGLAVQLGINECQLISTTFPASQVYTTLTLPLGACGANLTNVHVLFTVGTSAPAGGIILLDNIRFEPVPTRQFSDPQALSFPLSTQTFGVVPLQAENPPPITFPSDQVLRNVAAIYESSLTLLALLDRGQPQDMTNALEIANAFDYALQHENQGWPLPVAPDGSMGLHNAYESGDIAFLNDQQSPAGAAKAGNARLAGFTATVTCAPSNYCLVLDGATGGNEAFAILALVSAYQRFNNNSSYLNDARTIGNWIAGNLIDNTGTGYGGYYVGYPDDGVPPPKPLITSKSVENNADIFSAFTALARADTANAAQWTTRANIAGDFVINMFDPVKGRFNVGTVPVGTAPSAGTCPTGPQAGSDVINTCDFLDANTFTTLALASSPRYRSQINWRLPVQYVIANFAQTVTVGSQTFQGFSLVPIPVSGPNGVAWEFTGQVCAMMLFVDRLYGESTFNTNAQSCVQQIRQAQQYAPFLDGLGLVAATLPNGNTLPPLDQCLNTPYQCIPERVGLAATNWGIFADLGGNPFPTAAVRPGDFNGDGNPDLVWQNDNTSQVTVHYYGGIQGATDIGWNWLNEGGEPTGWVLVGAADFDGNGVPDLVWEYMPTGQVTVNYYGGSGGATYLGWNWLNEPGVAGWTVVAVADMDGNGVPDLIWQNNTTNQITVNYYGGAGGAVYQGWNWLNSAGEPAGWHVVAAADFDGNGTPDLVWQYAPTRQVSVNYYGGAGGAAYQGWNWLNAAGVPGWTVVGANDFDGNGVPDLVWQNDATAQVTVNYYGGTGGATYIGWNWLAASGYPGWKAVVPR